MIYRLPLLVGRVTNWFVSVNDVTHYIEFTCAEVAVESHCRCQAKSVSSDGAKVATVVRKLL